MAEDDNTDAPPGSVTLMASLGHEARVIHIYDSVKQVSADLKELTEAINGRSKFAQSVVELVGKMGASITNPSRNFLILVALLTGGAAAMPQLLSALGLLPGALVEQTAPVAPSVAVEAPEATQEAEPATNAP